jgi:hypothetical protein
VFAKLHNELCDELVLDFTSTLGDEHPASFKLRHNALLSVWWNDHQPMVVWQKVS